MRVRLGVLLAAACGTLSIGATTASAAIVDPFGLCKERGHSCSHVSVPLDWSGAVPGTLKVQILRQRARNAARPPLVVVGSGPGQSGDALSGLIGTEGRSREVVVVDPRGTGGSGVLRCAALQRAGLHGNSREAAACARRLGPRRGLYTVGDSAQDLEAVRKAIGAERIAIVGGRHGARIAIEYARRHPDRVDRLVLDAPDPPSGSDALRRSSLAMLPRVVGSRCAGGACRKGSPDPVGDLVTVARRLERGSLRGAVTDGSGRARRVTIEPFDLFRLFEYGSGGQLLGLSATELPGIVRNARRGDLRPLARAQGVVERLDSLLSGRGFVSMLSMGAYAASKCEESRLPWPRSVPVPERDAAMRALVEGLPSSAFAPFGPRAAMGSDVVELCRQWPTSPAEAEPPAPLPAIPTLILAPTEDLGIPVEGAEEAARLIPGARLIPFGENHGVMGTPRCAERAARRFLAGGEPDDCPRSARRPRAASPAPPLSLSEVAAPAGMRSPAGRTAVAVAMTLRDGARQVPSALFARSYKLLAGGESGRGWLRRARRPIGVGGLRGGQLTVSLVGRWTVLRGASFVPGVRVSGRIEHFLDGHRQKRRGTVRVSGPAAVDGVLTVRGRVLSGELGGRLVRVALTGGAFDRFSIGSSAATAVAALRKPLP